MKAGEAAAAVGIVAAGFLVGWSAIGAMLPEPPVPAEQPAPVEQQPVSARPVVRAVPTEITPELPEPRLVEQFNEDRAQRKVEKTEPARERPKVEVSAETAPPAPAYATEAALVEALKANPNSVDLFARTHAALKKAAYAAPAAKQRAVLQAINAANLTGDADGLARGLELLRAP